MPVLSLFAPLPLALMIPFMAAQSFAMGEAFGKGFQSGKRRISSMTNEQFNAKTQPQIFAETTADISAMIPSMKKQMTEFTFLQSDIIQELIGYIKKLPSDIQQGLIGKPETDDNTNFLHALGIGASGSSGSFESGDFAKETAQNIKSNIEAQKQLKQLQDATLQQLQQFKLLQASTQGVITKTQITNQKIKVPPPIVTKTQGRSGETMFSISPENAPTTGFIKSTPRTFKAPSKPRAPRSIVTMRNKLSEQLRAQTNRLQRLRSGTSGANFQSSQPVIKDIARIRAELATLNGKYQF